MNAMTPNKTDHARMDENDAVIEGEIEMAMRLVNLPVYIIYRHGRYYRRHSKSGAISALARIMTQKVFDRMDKPSHYPSIPAIINDVEAEKIGDSLPEYKQACHRCERRIRRLISGKKARQRAIIAWDKKWSDWVAQRAALMKSKPY